MAAMTIAGLAREGGVGVETVRYYQRRGLLAKPDRPYGAGGGGTRRYGDADVRRLCFIRTAQGAGFSLDEIADLMELDASRDRGRAREIARERLRELDRRIADLQAARSWLSRLEDECTASAVGPCPILLALEN
ncbi:MerR family transcriptional regulator [Sphingomonas nostoxanthinifaciens]|uniref:MerR family transcriptional regulator n=1 Tax=Sphingomonas nostoxanthinifaciens TaxID=2872652 RepID=UPI001CC21283|nr:MerR family transcriptional regulator [Sphingomonas nostoxanthinifaciens]UAK22860.1 MerR family DNA-binding protein [Sphingomonas nostoxanthinifaciens]